MNYCRAESAAVACAELFSRLKEWCDPYRQEAIERGAEYIVYRLDTTSDDDELFVRFCVDYVVDHTINVADYGGVRVGVIDAAALAAWHDAEDEDDMRAYFEAA